MPSICFRIHEGLDDRLYSKSIDCARFIQHEAPIELNTILENWLGGKFQLTGKSY